MRDWCFVHAADLHLDTPFAGIHADTPEMASLLRDASLDALDRLVEVALERRAAFVVLAGDIYDGTERGLRAQLRLRSALERLDAAGIATFMIHGNHDPVEEGWQAIRSWPQKVTVFGPDEVGAVPVFVDDQRVATVYGISYPHRAVEENLARRFRRHDEDGVHVAALHCTVGPQPDHAPYAPCSLDDLLAAGMDYWALGHVHRREVLHRGRHRGHPWVVYSGNTQGRSPKPSEQGPKGCYVVDVTPDAEGSPIGEPEFVALDSVRFASVDLDVGAVADLAELADGLQQAAQEQLTAAEGRALVLRARLVGRSLLHGDLAHGGALDGLLQVLRDAARGSRPPLWWDRLRDASRPVLDRDVLVDREDFTGALVRTVDGLGEDADALAELARDADTILRHLHPTPTAADIDELLPQAEVRALDVLAEEN